MRVMELMGVAAEKAAGCKVGLVTFEELRSKTDRQLIRIMESYVQRGIRAARQALDSADTWTVSAEQSYYRAELAYDEVSRLLPLLYAIAGNDLDKWTVSLRHLGELLKTLGSVCASASRK